MPQRTVTAHTPFADALDALAALRYDSEPVLVPRQLVTDGTAFSEALDVLAAQHSLPARPARAGIRDPQSASSLGYLHVVTDRDEPGTSVMPMDSSVVVATFKDIAMLESPFALEHQG